MTTRNIINSNTIFNRNIVNPNRNTTESDWIRNPAWLSIGTVSDTEQKFVGLYAVAKDSNFLALTVAGAYTVNWGDGTTENFATGVTAEHIYDYADADLNDTNRPVTFTGATSLVNRTTHGYANGTILRFYDIVTTTGISVNTDYYVINSTTNTFQISTTLGGSAVTLTGDGSGALLPYKQAIVTITPQGGSNLTSLNLHVKHSQTLLQKYDLGWLDIEVGSPNLTSLTLYDNNLDIVYMALLERCAIRSISSSITSLSYLFTNCYMLQSVSLPSTQFITDLSGMFTGCYSLKKVPLFNTSAVTFMNQMFFSCYNLQSVPLFNTASVTSMAGMFVNCYSLKSVPLFNTSAVTNMSSMFSACYNLESVPLFNTALVTDMSSMFQQCTNLKSVPLFNTVAVTTMLQMFAFCYSLQTIPLFNTAALTSTYGMFSNCWNLKSVPLFNTALVTNWYQMFVACYALKTVPLFNTSSATDMRNMFQNCRSLETVPLFNTSSATFMDFMFQQCTSLKTVPLFNTTLATSTASMFGLCSSLQNVPLFNTAAVTSMSQMFSSCISLKYIPALVTTAVSSSAGFNTMFSNCTNLVKIEAKNFRFTFSVAGCKLSATALNEIYTNLPTVTGQTITVSNNWGTAADNPAIATAKGWTVTG